MTTARESKAKPDQRRRFLLRRLSNGAALGATLAALAFTLPTPELAEAKTSADGFGAYAVASESEDAARDALTILRRGGTAADAAVTTALVAGVTAPGSSGIGGGGFVLGWDASTKQPYVLDFRETGPAALELEPFESRPLSRDLVGHLVGTPGEVRGLFELHRRAGKLAWSELVAPAERRARRGFIVRQHLGSMLATSFARKKVAADPTLAALYYPNGRAAAVGVRLVNEPLANSLAKLAQQGPDALYRGDVAEEIVKVAGAHGSPLSTKDLADYQPVERKPLRTRYDGYDVLTMPPPSAGGLMLSQLLRLFSPDELRRLGHGTPAYQHLIAEGMRAAVADRMRYVGDPDHQKVDVEALLDLRRLAVRRSAIALDRTHALPRFGLEEHGTHHLVTSDRSGNVVSLTTTVNRFFGSGLATPSAGIVLNDELDDFTGKESVEPFGMTESPNRPRPGARPVSSMTPTIVIRGDRPVLALGGSGGMTIATNVTQCALSALVFDQSPREVVRAPRIYIPTSDAFLMVEEGTPDAHVADLERRGEIVAVNPFGTSAVQMLRFDGPRVEAAADPRKHGAAFVE